VFDVPAEPANPNAFMPVLVAKLAPVIAPAVSVLTLVAVVIVPAVMFVGLATEVGNVTPAAAVTVWPAS
jgi:hypothetical protein